MVQRNLVPKAQMNVRNGFATIDDLLKQIQANVVDASVQAVETFLSV